MRLRHLCLALACATVSLFPGYGQTNTGFTAINTPTNVRPVRNTYAVDVNNDGATDLVVDALQLPNAFTVFTANGNGTFTPGYSYTFPSQYQGTAPMVSGDFNSDGKVDLLFVLAGTNQIALFLGNGDGTFQSPQYESIAIPSGQWFNDSIITADFNKDGKLDLVAEANDNSNAGMYFIPGLGNGQFGTATSFYNPPLGEGVGGNISIGDFDGDGSADVAYLEYYNCNPGNCASILHVDFGNGDGSFTDTKPYSSASQFNFGTGDLNNDAHTDIYGFDYSSSDQLITLYGQADRTLNLYTQSAGVASYTTIPKPVMADFNGDGIMDIAATTQDSSGSANLQIYVGTDSPGQFTQQTISTQGSGAPMLGDFDQDGKPDIAYVVSSASQPSPPPNIVAELNVTSAPFISCAYPPNGSGINVCQPPATTSSSAQFVITAHSYGQLRKIEVWVDGSKIGEQWHTWGHSAWFSMTNDFSSGTHSATVYAADVDNRLLRYDFSFTAGAGGGSCSAPSSPGVNVCSPANGSYISSPVNVSAAANIVGSLARMEIWVDGVKYYTETTSTSFNTSLTLPDGYHQFDIYAVNTDGTKYETTVFATVQSGGCPADAGYDVHVCSPISGSTVSSPVQAVATAHITGTLARMEVWVDGVKMFTETSSLSFSTPIPLPSGLHQFDFYAVNTSETKWETTVFATVP